MTAGPRPSPCLLRAAPAVASLAASSRALLYRSLRLNVVHSRRSSAKMIHTFWVFQSKIQVIQPRYGRRRDRTGRTIGAKTAGIFNYPCRHGVFGGAPDHPVLRRAASFHAAPFRVWPSHTAPIHPAPERDGFRGRRSAVAAQPHDRSPGGRRRPRRALSASGGTPVDGAGAIHSGK